MPYEQQFTLLVTPPFRLDYTVWALRRRQKNLIDKWSGKKYVRVFVIDGNAVQVTIEQKSETKLAVTIRSENKIPGIDKIITDTLERMLGTDKNLEGFYKLALQDKYLKQLSSSFKGVKPPRFPTIFEALVNAIACQQVTLDLGIALLNTLAEKYGRKFENMDTIQYAFPLPEDLAEASEQDIKNIGFSYQKARTIIGVSKLFTRDKMPCEEAQVLSNEELANNLVKIKGIGRWSAEYVLLRGFGRIDIFPGDDVGAQNNLKRIFTLNARPTYEEIKHLTAKWYPYAGIVYFHLLLDKLQMKNLL